MWKKNHVPCFLCFMFCPDSLKAFKRHIMSYVLNMAFWLTTAAQVALRAQLKKLSPQDIIQHRRWDVVEVLMKWSHIPTRVSVSHYSYIVSWFISPYLRDVFTLLTYIGVIIHLLSATDIPVPSTQADLEVKVLKVEKEYHGNLRGPPQCHPPPRNKALLRDH